MTFPPRVGGKVLGEKMKLTAKQKQKRYRYTHDTKKILKLLTKEVDILEICIKCPCERQICHRCPLKKVDLKIREEEKDELA
jgi:hypothetical protein